MIEYSATTHYGKNTPTGNNWGDAVSPYLFEQLSGRKPNVRILPEDKLVDGEHVLLIVGSILGHATKFTGVWGAGYISDQSRCRTNRLTVYAVRGPLTRKILLNQGLSCPKVFGDPVLLFPRFYKPEIQKKYKYGIVPHYVDRQNPWLKRVGENPNIKIIDVLNPSIFKFVDDVLSCERIMSSSLHGLVCADAYNIPSLWIQLSDKVHGDGFKFKDYFLSVQRKDRRPVLIKEDTAFKHVSAKFLDYKIKIDLEGLLEACPIWSKIRSLPKLHIACGKRILLNWENLDLKRPPKGSKPFDALKPWQYKTNSVSAVYIEDFLEHLNQAQQYKFFAEAYRVLASEGILRINCPDAKWSIKNWVLKKDPAKLGMKALDLIKEHYTTAEHKFLPTVSYLLEVLPLFGFKEVTVKEKDVSNILQFPGDSRPLPGTRAPEANIYVEAVK